MTNQLKNIFIWAIIFVLGSYILSFIIGDNINNYEQISYSELINSIENNSVNKVSIQGNDIKGITNTGSNFYAYVDRSLHPILVEKLSSAGVNLQMLPPDTKMNSLFNIFISWFPMILLIGVWMFFMKQMGAGGSKTLGFAKSKAKLMSHTGPKVTFKDIAGIDEAKEDLTELVEFLRDPMKFQRLGGKIPKGCLLIGMPGTGKTLLAKAISGEANVPFFSISGSDFVEMFVGVGASRVRDMFAQAKKHAPCIIFIDEIDAVGRHRGVGLGGGNDEREQTLNQILVEMDGFESNEGVIIIAATNRPDVLDKALLRPGRFDRQINVPIPDLKGREQILNVYLKKIKHDKEVKALTLARGTPGFTGAELANLINESALLSGKKNKDVVTMVELEEAKDKLMMGSERKSMIIKDEEKKLTAYHEAGHAIVGLNVKSSDPIHKATIIPRGRALGMVMRLPEDDRTSITKERMECDIAVFMGGRVAEEMIFGKEKVTSGASSDIQQATRIARSMVMYYGLSDEVGPILHSPQSNHHYDASTHPIDNARSDKTSEIIDKEVIRILKEGHKLAAKILKNKANDLHKLAKALIEKETMTGDDIKELLNIKSKKSEKDTHNKEEDDHKKKEINEEESKSLKKKNTKKETKEGNKKD